MTDDFGDEPDHQPLVIGVSTGILSAVIVFWLGYLMWTIASLAAE
jgi:hypothetical protein